MGLILPPSHLWNTFFDDVSRLLDRETPVTCHDHSRWYETVLYHHPAFIDHSWKMTIHLRCPGNARRIWQSNPPPAEDPHGIMQTILTTPYRHQDLETTLNQIIQQIRHAHTQLVETILQPKWQ